MENLRDYIETIAEEIRKETTHLILKAALFTIVFNIVTTFIVYKYIFFYH